MQTNDKLHVFKGRMFWVWKEHPRVTTWRRYIDRFHRDDLEWHYKVNCIFLHPSKTIGVLVDAMHDFNMYLYSLLVQLFSFYSSIWMWSIYLFRLYWYIQVLSNVVNKHFDFNMKPKMTLEKLQMIATTPVDVKFKLCWLWWWNSSPKARVSLRFPVGDVKETKMASWIVRV